MKFLSSVDCEFVDVSSIEGGGGDTDHNTHRAGNCCLPPF